MRATIPIAIVVGVGAVGLFIWLDKPPSPAADTIPLAAAPPPQHAPRPAMDLGVGSPPPEFPPVVDQPTNLVVRMFKGEQAPALTSEQVEPFLAANRRNAASLLAAARSTRDQKYLLEAMAKFPNDPRVDFAAAFRTDASPAERRQWLETLQKSDPNNALSNFLLAREDFKSGNRDAAMQQLAATGSNPHWTDYSADFVQNAEEAYAAAGYSPAESKLIAASDLLLPHLAGLKQLGISLGEAAQSSLQAGDPGAAQATLMMEANLGRQLAAPQQQTLIATLVGIAVERMGLAAMDPAAPYGDTGQTVQDRLNAITQQRADLKALTQQTSAIEPTLSEPDLTIYYDRMKAMGAVPSMQWLVNKFGPH